MTLKIDALTIDRLLSGTPQDKLVLQNLINDLIGLSSIIEGSGAPTFKADKHQQYFDTATSKYYRNTDGGATWVALN